jgi:hypothetical protein
VAGEVGKDDAPGEGVVPGSAADADVLALLGEDFEGSLVALGDGWNAQYFLRTHVSPVRDLNLDFTTSVYRLVTHVSQAGQAVCLPA